MKTKRTTIGPDGLTTCCEAMVSVFQDDGVVYCKHCYEAVGNPETAGVESIKLPALAKRPKRPKPEPSGLFWDRRGSICCAEHAPYRGSDTWRFDGWRSIPKSAAVWEDGSKMTCESCEWAKRRAAE